MSQPLASAAFSAEEGTRGMTTLERAHLSEGTNTGSAVYDMVVDAIRERGGARGTLVDVGCGKGQLFTKTRHLCERYIGIDIARYREFPAFAEFVEANLDTQTVSLPDNSADVVASIETIEHLENPRAFMRELARLAKPLGRVIVTTPNQLSYLSLLTLLMKGQFNQFQEAPGLYPAHITHLLEEDLVRIARECGLVEISISYSNLGRIPLTAVHWPSFCRGKRFSDNLMLTALKPKDGAAYQPNQASGEAE